MNKPPMDFLTTGADNTALEFAVDFYGRDVQGLLFFLHNNERFVYERKDYDTGVVEFDIKVMDGHTKIRFDGDNITFQKFYVVDGVEYEEDEENDVEV